VIFTPQGQFLSSGNICLGDATSNVVKYSAVIEFIHDALSHGISYIRVYLDAQLVVSQLNGVYRVYDPTLHQQFLRVLLMGPKSIDSIVGTKPATKAQLDSAVFKMEWFYRSCDPANLSMGFVFSCEVFSFS
jgi:ribonuclease HI